MTSTQRRPFSSRSAISVNDCVAVGLVADQGAAERPTARSVRANSLPRDLNAGCPIDIRMPPVNHWLHRSRPPKAVIARAIYSSTTGHHSACTRCSHSAAVSRDVHARDRPRERARARSTGGGVTHAPRAQARDDDEHGAESAPAAEAHQARASDHGGRAAVAPDGRAPTTIPWLPSVDLRASLLGSERRLWANRPGRLPGVHAVSGSPSEHARPLLRPIRVRSRQGRGRRLGDDRFR